MYLYWCIISHVFNIFVVAASAFVFLLTSKGTFLNIISLITLAFFLNAVNLIMSWYLAGIYLIAVGMSSLMGGTDIFVGFLWVIDLGVGLIFFIFMLHFTTFLQTKTNIDKRNRVLNSILFLVLIFMNMLFLNPDSETTIENLSTPDVSFFYVTWYDFYEIFLCQTVTDLNLLKEMYFFQNSIEFFIINFVLLYGIFSAVILTFVIKRVFTILNFSQFKNLKLKNKADSVFFLRNQNFIKQQNTLSGTRVWMKKKKTKHNQ